MHYTIPNMCMEESFLEPGMHVHLYTTTKADLSRTPAAIAFSRLPVTWRTRGPAPIAPHAPACPPHQACPPATSGSGWLRHMLLRSA